jgi:hypothetical protein
MLEKELRICNKPIFQHLEANRIELKELLILEHRYKFLLAVLQETSLESAMIKLQKAIPCILHMENRISDTMITHLLRHGIKLREEDRRVMEELMYAVELIFKEQLFGLPGAASNWKFPLNSDGTMGEVKLSNWRARRVVDKIEALVDCCLPNQEKNIWNKVFNVNREVVKAMQQKQDFSDDDINEFQSKVDNFFRKWVNLVGYDGITNYVHMLGAGHVRYFLKKWRNLNRFSNQGWEAYNQMVASFWHHRTTKGGSKTNCSKIEPIARWLCCQHSAVW